jgi:capsular exopolysaccharide synthesis family protein
MAGDDEPESAVTRVRKRLARLGRARQARPGLVPVMAGGGGARHALTEFTPASRRHRGARHSRAGALHDETPEYLQYWRAVAMRKWSILGITLIVALLTALVVVRMTPVYRSSVTLLIETDPTKVFPVGDASSGASLYYREYFQTQAEILKSREVAQRVVNELNLAEYPEFDPRPKPAVGLNAWVNEYVLPLKAYITKPPDPPTPASMESDVLRRFSEHLSVEPGRQSQLIKVSFDSQDPALAAAVANATAQAYLQADLDARSSVNRNAGQQINERLEELRAQLNASEKALQAYRDREGMLDNKSTVLGGTARQLDELTQKLVDARVRLSDAEQAYLQVKAGEASNYESVPAVVKSQAIQRAREVEADAEKKLAEVSQRYGPDHPRHAAATSDLAAARANTRRQIQNLVASVVKEYEAARATEKAIQDSLNQSKASIASLNRKEIQLGMLERDAATNRQVYQAFLSRFKETSAAKNSPVASARIVESAVTSLTPIRPNKTRTVLIAAALTLFLCMVGAIVLHRRNNTLQTSDDVERKLNWPMLAALPVLPRRRNKNRGAVVIDKPHDVYAESIRVASTEVLLSSLNVPHKVVAVTSCILDEGKSTFAINFAHSQAKTKQVLLIEGDMRRPSFDKAMILAPGQKGLVDLLAGTGTLEECLLQVDGGTLHVIAAGGIPSNPQELLSSRTFSDLLAVLRERYDMIIIDTPPVQLVSDALIIGAQSTGIIFVVKADATPVPMARRALARIASADIPIFGVILNQQDFKRAEKYYGEYSGYGKYWYGSGYGVKR